MSSINSLLENEDIMDEENKQPEKRRNLRLVDKYDNDDYSRFAGPDYSDEPFELGEEEGVSGEVDEDERNFTGLGPKGYKRSDDRIYEDVCDKLMRNHDVDATNIGVKVSSGVVYLSGKVDSRKVKKTAELVIEDLPGVRDVRNELSVIKSDKLTSGPTSATRKDLGLN
jgi:hypothetical protein